MSHHNENVEVLFVGSVGSYVRGQVASLPVDLWLFSLLRGKQVEVLNPANLVFNSAAQSLEEIWVKETPKVEAKPPVKEEPQKSGKTEDFVRKVLAAQVSENVE